MGFPLWSQCPLRHEEGRCKVIGKLFRAFPFAAMWNLMFTMLWGHLFPREQVKDLMSEIVVSAAFRLIAINQNYVQAWNVAGGTRNALGRIHIQYEGTQFIPHALRKP